MREVKENVIESLICPNCGHTHLESCNEIFVREIYQDLMKKTEANLKKMEEKLFGKKEPIPIYTRSHHCIDMKIGGQILEIVPANYL
jgi:hypothetical protein